MSRHTKAFPVADVPESDVEGPIGDNADDGPKPDNEAEDLGGPPRTTEQKVKINNTQ